MTASWPIESLGDICKFKYGKSLKSDDRVPGVVEVMGSNGRVGWHDQSITAGPTVVVGRKGSIGQIAYSRNTCWPIDTTYYIDSSTTKQDLRWLYWTLQSVGLTGMNKSAAVPGLNREDAYRVRIPLPPLPDQRRIADILDRADNLRGQRRRAIQMLDELVTSTFLADFGSLGDEPEVYVSDLVDSSNGGIRTGPFGSDLLHSEFVDEGIAVLGIDNIVGNTFSWAKPRFITAEKYKQLQRYTVRPDDVVITIMGTVGRCAVIPSDIGTAINTKHLCCISLDRELCEPEYLHHYFLKHPRARKYLASVSKGAIMDGLNMSIIRSMPVRLPGLAEQRAFVSKLKKADQLMAQHLQHLANLDELFASLQHRAFQGEL